MTAFSRNLRVFAWLNAVIQAAFPLTVAFTPAIAAASEKGRFLQQADTTPLRTRVYTLAAGETVATVAEKYNMSPAALHRLNQFRTFTRSFENLQPGDELDVPLSPLPAVQWQGQDSPPADTSQAQKMAGVATQAGHFFADNPGRDATASLARGVASGAAEKEIQQWLGQAGTARVQLNTDRNLSLKNAQLDLLVPLSEQKDSLVFTQSSLHRTDDRGQANLGLGYRWFAGDWMVGGNTFLDYDLSRDHARLGLGLEYGRDFLKLSANSYHRLTNWKDAPELEDYQARPASGWDIRAQGWLPALPQFGATLTWEQYYGNEVALSGTNNRQRNPYALTGGVNYTPFPLLTFSAEQMQGKSGSNDTRLGAGVNYQPGVPWRQQINPEAVAGLRSLAGSRYDLVERNNNIVLEYRKKTVIHLRSAGQVTGFAGEQKSLGVSVTTRHGLERIDWSAAPLLAAGGKIVENGTDWAVELPAWNTAPDGVNSYTLTAVAVDTRGNVSNQSTTRVTLQAPEVSTINSEFTPAASTLPADGSSVSVLTLSIRDGQGKAMDVAPGEVEVTASGVKSASVSSPSRQGPGVFEVTVTAGEDAETVHLTPVVRGESLAPATVVINDVSPVPDRSSLEVDRSHYVAGEEMMLTVTLKDAQNHPVTGQAAALTEEAVTAPGATLKAGSNWTDNGDGSYTATYTAMTTSSGNRATLTLAGWSTGSQSGEYAITADSPASVNSAIGLDSTTYIAGSDMTVTVTLKDAQDNPVSGQAAALTAGAVTVPGATLKASSNWIDNGDGSYSRSYTAQVAGMGMQAVLRLNGWSSGVASEAYAITAGEIDEGRSTLSVSALKIVANNNAMQAYNRDNATISLNIVDAFNNGVKDLADKITFVVVNSGGQIVNNGVTIDNIASSSNIAGQYTARIYGNVTGTYTIKVKVNGVDVGNLNDNLILYSYDFVLNTTQRSIIIDGTYQFLIQATATDTGIAENVSSNVTWRSGNTAVASVTNDGIIKGTGVGTTTITATGMHGLVAYTLTAELTVKRANESPRYGTPRAGDTSTTYIIEPPSYSISIRSGSIIDAVGTTEHITGGTGGNLATIKNVNEVISIDIYEGAWNGAHTGPYITRLVFNMSDGSSITSGNHEGVTNPTKSTYIIPDGFVLQGVIPGGSDYIRTIQFISMPRDVIG